VLVLGAVLVETRRARAGSRCCCCSGSPGLLRPEAWLFAGAYALWLREPRLLALAAAAPLLWAATDLVVTGNPLHSLTGTRENAGTLQRITGLDDVPVTVPRRLGEILREPVLLGAAGGGLLALAWLRERRGIRLGALTGVASLAAFCVLAAAGLPILGRYLLLPASILAIFGAAGALGWLALAPGDPRRRPGRPSGRWWSSRSWRSPRPRPTGSATCAGRSTARRRSRPTWRGSRAPAGSGPGGLPAGRRAQPPPRPAARALARRAATGHRPGPGPLGLPRRLPRSRLAAGRPGLHPRPARSRPHGAPATARLRPAAGNASWRLLTRDCE
jgi:hypothetical protein